MRKSSKNIKMTSHKRAKLRIRKKLFGTAERPRVSVFRSERHTYAQAICDLSGKTLASASTKESEVQEKIGSVDAPLASNESKSTKGVRAAMAVGLVLSDRCKKQNVEEVIFDRNGRIYHGRVRAVAEGLREGGVKL